MLRSGVGYYYCSSGSVHWFVITVSNSSGGGGGLGEGKDFHHFAASVVLVVPSLWLRRVWLFSLVAFVILVVVLFRWMIVLVTVSRTVASLILFFILLFLLLPHQF